jgi:hypothetical protein
MNKKGWYHFSDMDGFKGIEFLPDGLAGTVDYGDFEYRKSAYGPFKTFGEAKKDAIAFFQTDVETARQRMADVRECLKAKSYFKGPYDK